MMRVPSVGPVLVARVPRAQIAPSSRCGRNSDPIVRASIIEPARVRTETPAVIQRQRMASPKALPYTCVRNDMSGLRHSFVPLGNTRLASTGPRNIEYSSAPASAKATVQAIGRNKRPSTR